MNIQIEFKDNSIIGKVLTVTSPDDDGEISFCMKDDNNEVYFWLDKKAAYAVAQFIMNQYREV